MWLAIALVLAALWRRPWIVVWIGLADLAASLIAYGIREAVGRPRPAIVHPHPKPLVATPHSGSFPSGHSAVAFACATVLAALAPRLAAPFFLLAAAIAFSRVYVGVHYPLDVIGGAALGVLVGLVVAQAFLGRRWQRRRAGGAKRV